MTSLNNFAGIVNLNDTIPSGLNCGAINPSSMTGSGTATVSCSASLAGNYTLTLTGTSSQLVHAATTLFQFWDFNASASSPAPVNAGASAISTITITAANHFNGLVSLTDTAQSGLVCGSINPTSVTGSGTATLSCTATIAGNYTLTLTGTNGALSHSASILVSVQDYTITARPISVRVNAGSTGLSAISISALNNFSGTVTLYASGTTGLSTTISPGSLTGGSGTATLTFSSGTAGNYTATVTSSSGTVTHTTTVSVQVVDFTVAASLSPLTILAGVSGNSTLTITSLNSFNGAVGLTLATSMGLTATVTPASIAVSGTSTLTVSASGAGDYAVTILATSGSLSHMIIVVVHVLDYSLTGSPVNLVAPIGASTGSTLTLQSLDGYAGNVSLAFTVQAGSIVSPPGGGLGGGHRALILAPPIILPNVSISPGSFQLVAGGTQQSTVSVLLPTNLSTGSYLITVTASDGVLSHTTVLTIVATDFSMTTTPNSLSLSPGSNTTITLNLQSLNFFQGSVTLTVTGSNGGPSGTLSTSTVLLTISSNVNLNVTILVPSTTLAGNYTITIQAISGTVSHSLSISVIVPSGFATILSEMLSPHNSVSITGVTIFALLTVFGTLKFRTYHTQNASLSRRRRIEIHIHNQPATSPLVSYSSRVPLLWRPASRDEF